MTNKKLTSSVVVEFLDYKSVEPADLITLGKQYENHKDEFVSLLKKMQGRNGFIFKTVRVGNDGKLIWKERVGTVQKITDEGFTFLPRIDGMKEDEEVGTSLIRFCNVLGEIPMLLSTEEISPFEFGCQFENYLDFKRKARELLEKTIGETHSLKIHLRYGSDYPQRNGGEIIECEIVKVHQSNVEINQLRSYLGSGENLCLDLYQGPKIVKFINPKFYIWKFEYLQGIKNRISPFDEDE